MLLIIVYCYTFINLEPPKYSSCLRRDVFTKRETYVAFPSLIRKPWIILQLNDKPIRIGGPNTKIRTLDTTVYYTQIKKN